MIWIKSLNRNGGMAPWGTPSPKNDSPVFVLTCDRKMIRKGSQSLTKQFATSLAPLLPTSVTEIWEPSRDFAHIKLPAKTSGNKAGCLVGMSKEEPNIFVVTADGEFLNYKVDLIQGGEGKLDKQYSYLPTKNSPCLPSSIFLFGWVGTDVKTPGFARGKVGDTCGACGVGGDGKVSNLGGVHVFDTSPFGGSLQCAGDSWCINGSRYLVIRKVPLSAPIANVRSGSLDFSYFHYECLE